jgi:hypothetical protein
MQEVVGFYSKTFHFRQVDRGDELPLGNQELMMSFTKDDQVSCSFSILSTFEYSASSPCSVIPLGLIITCANIAQGTMG